MNYRNKIWSLPKFENFWTLFVKDQILFLHLHIVWIFFKKIEKGHFLIFGTKCWKRKHFLKFLNIFGNTNIFLKLWINFENENFFEIPGHFLKHKTFNENCEYILKTRTFFQIPKHFWKHEQIMKSWKIWKHKFFYEIMIFLENNNI